MVRCSEFVKWINGGVSQLRNRQATVNTLSPVHIKSMCLNIFMLWSMIALNIIQGQKTVEHKHTTQAIQAHFYRGYKH